MKGTKLLDDDGTASMATMIMLSHHAFRRDLGRFAQALAALDPARVEHVRAEWNGFYQALHGHHEKEDSDIFPAVRTEHPELVAVLERLSAQHAKIDPLLGRGEAAFAKLPDTGDATAVVRELQALLDEHLVEEEASIIPTLRGAKEFPAPESDEIVAMYADGFAWSTHGIAPSVLEKVYAMLPPTVSARLPAAAKGFEARCERVWGSFARTASETSVP